MAHSAFSSSSSSSSPLRLLPPSAQPLASSLSPQDLSVLAYLVAFSLLSSPPSLKPCKPRPPSPFPKPHLSPSLSPKASPSASHKPCFSCHCFDCYSDFWSRWNASPRRDVIDQILDLLDHHLDEKPLPLSGAESKAFSPLDSHPSDGRKRQDKKPKVFERDLSGKKAADGRRGKLSWQKRGTNAKIKPTKTKLQSVVQSSSLQSVVEGTVVEVPSTASNTLNGPVEDGQKDTDLSTSEQEVSLTEIVLSEIMTDTISPLNGLQGKNGSKQRGGKRKNNQITPLDCEEGTKLIGEVDQPFFEAGESMDVNANASAVVSRVEDSNLRGGGFFGRIFPDAMGRVATRLWELVSLRMRSHTMDFY